MHQVLNWIDARPAQPTANRWLDKFDPHTGALQSRLADSTADDVARAVDAAAAAQAEWANTPAVRRGQVLTDLAVAMHARREELAACVATETGKPPQDARGEVQGAILQAHYFAGEGMRLHGRTYTSAMPGKQSQTVRQPRGVCGLIVPANTPIANIAWKVFPALICGNAVVLKASEDAPRIAQLVAEIATGVGLPAGALNVVQGGRAPGAALVENERVAVISFTGSTSVGRWIAEAAGRRLARVSLELGGKNAFVVCDDADLDQAVRWAALSAFSNAGQRCAAGSRILVFKSVYQAFLERFVARTRSLRLGVAEGCDLGPLISGRQQQQVLAAIEEARTQGARVVCGGRIPPAEELRRGFYVEPTVIDGLPPDAGIACREIFGPLCTVHPVDNLEQALAVTNSSEYGLTAAIHTRSVDRGWWFATRVRTGVANVNLGTFGSEAHMPFGGFGASGNGSREPGIEALDVYSELKNISFLVRDDQV
jgi:aldehyde dehydrogenase (NAD+)